MAVAQGFLGSCSPCGYYAMFTIANTFPPMFLREMQRPCRSKRSERPGKIRRGRKILISVRIPHNNAAMFGPRPQLRSSFIPPFTPSLYMRLVPLRSHWQFRREQFEKIGVKKWRNNARTSRRMSAMSGRQQSLGGSSMADYQLPRRGRFGRGRTRRSKSRLRRGSGGPSAKKKEKRKRDAFEDSECRVLKSKSLCLSVTEERRAYTFRLEYFNHDFDKCEILSCLLTLEKVRILMQLDIHFFFFCAMCWF